jgi:hypothetical protein
VLSVAPGYTGIRVARVRGMVAEGMVQAVLMGDLDPLAKRAWSMWSNSPRAWAAWASRELVEQRDMLWILKRVAV